MYQGYIIITNQEWGGEGGMSEVHIVLDVHCEEMYKYLGGNEMDVICIGQAAPKPHHHKRFSSRYSLLKTMNLLKQRGFSFVSSNICFDPNSMQNLKEHVVIMENF